jgi:hypothetical protein
MFEMGLFQLSIPNAQFP